MRFVTAAAVLTLTLSAGAALAAEDLSPEAQAGVDIAKQYARTANIKFRGVKVGADGNVCGKVTSGDRDLEFMVNPNDQTLWLNEGTSESDSNFGWGPQVLRSNGDRKQFKVWKACQAGQ